MKMKRPIYYAIIVVIIVSLAIIFHIANRLVAWPPNVISGVGSQNYSATPMTQLSIFYCLKRNKGLVKQFNQLYLLTTCPNVSRDRSQFEESHLSERPYYYRFSRKSWKTQIGMIELPIRWNYWSDTIEVGKQTFDRNNGNVFVSVRRPTGEWDSRQCGTLGADASYEEAAQYVLENYSGQLPRLEWSE